MSRHRNIRSMNYSDEYDGFDDVYGHSVEEEFCMSPSDAAFMYNRDDPQRIGVYINSQKDIAEEDEGAIDEGISNLCDIDKAKLESCLELMKKTFGSAVPPRQQMIDAILSHDFDSNKAMNFILDRQVTTATNQPPEKVFSVQQSTKTIDTESPQQQTIKVIATGNKQKQITKGFDLLPVVAGDVDLTPISQVLPNSGRISPIGEGVADGNKRTNCIDAAVQYGRERGKGKERISLVVIGHVDAGKSTLMGHLLCALGQVHQKTMHKYEQESRKLGKQSFMYAWVLDETGEERNRGITMDVGRSQFETKTKQVTLLDAPGHKDFIPNMISGAGQADVALLVVDATRGEFETGFDFGGQTREHAFLVRSLGVAQLAVAINKLDTVNWSRERFDEIKDKLKVFLKQAGFREPDVQFVPCSGLTGHNLVEKSDESCLNAWYTGPTLLDVIDNFRSPERPISSPFRLSINDIFKGTGSGFCVSGRVETGCLSVGDRVLLCPSREQAIVKTIFLEEIPHSIVFAGDQATITLSGVEIYNVAVGYVLCDPQKPVQVSTKFQCRIVVFNITTPITRGFPVVLHHQSLVEPANVCKLISQLNRSTGEIIKKHPRFLLKQSSAIVEIQINRPIALELYSDCKELGRIMLRVGGVTIAAGLITKIISD